MEIPDQAKSLNYLDISIRIDDNKIEYEWYQKQCHSGILLREDSHLPQHVKKNFVSNTMNRIEKRCSNSETKDRNIEKFKNSLVRNGYTENKIASYKRNDYRNKTNKKQSKKSPLVLNYISEETNRRINNLIRRYDLEVRLVSKPAPSLTNVLKKRDSKVVHHNCDICDRVGKNTIVKQGM